jgi:hypothetical protein
MWQYVLRNSTHWKWPEMNAGGYAEQSQAFRLL